MNKQALIAQLVDYPYPREVYAEVDAILEREQQSRGKFRQWLEPDVKAEFILGEVVVHSPAKHGHNLTVMRISTLLNLHCTYTGQGTTLVEKALVETRRNDFEPDVSVWLQERAADFTDDMNYYPAPDLVVEVLSKSTENRDRGIKYQDYLHEGVTEYWIVDYRSEIVEQHLVGEGYGKERVYQKTVLQKEDTLACNILPGFSVPVGSLFYADAFAETLRGLGGAA